MNGFEGIGDFGSDDPWQRYIAHQAAKGDYPTRREAQAERDRAYVCVVDESAGLRDAGCGCRKHMVAAGCVRHDPQARRVSA